MTLRLQDYMALTLKYVESEENVGDYSSLHPYKKLLKVIEVTHYVNFVVDCGTPNAMTPDVIKKIIENGKLLHQIKRLARQSNCYKLNKLLIFLVYHKNHNNIKHFLKTDSETNSTNCR